MKWRSEWKRSGGVIRERANRESRGSSVFRSVGKRSEGVSGRGLKKRRSDKREIKEQGKENITACAYTLGHASSCDEGSCVGCMDDVVVGQCSGGVECYNPFSSSFHFTFHSYSLSTYLER